MFRKVSALLATILCCVTCAVPDRFALAAQTAAPSISESEAHDIAVEAFIYFYPLVTMDVTRRVATNVEPGKIPGFGPVNAFSHFRQFPSAQFRAVVRPN